jgi:sensor domain CHASE-containing protein
MKYNLQQWDVIVSADVFFHDANAQYSHANAGEVTFKDNKGNFAVLCDDDEEYIHIATSDDIKASNLPEDLKRLIRKDLKET